MAAPRISKLGGGEIAEKAKIAVVDETARRGKDEVNEEALSNWRPTQDIGQMRIER